MDQRDHEEKVLAASDARGDESEDFKMVPVGESIRYRRRAQVAEKQNEALEAELAEAREQAKELAERLSDTEAERELSSKLAAAGAVDIEAGLLLARAMITDGEVDADTVVERLKRDKGYLFGGASRAVGAGRRTSGARDALSRGEAAIERAAKRAARTGSRQDLQEYLKLRRNIV